MVLPKARKRNRENPVGERGFGQLPCFGAGGFRRWPRPRFFVVALAEFRRTRENGRAGGGLVASGITDRYDLGRNSVAETNNQMPEQKSNLVIRVPLSADSYASIYFSSNDGRAMSEREWWHLRQVVELASKAFTKPEERAM